MKVSWVNASVLEDFLNGAECDDADNHYFSGTLYSITYDSDIGSYCIIH